MSSSSSSSSSSGDASAAVFSGGAGWAAVQGHWAASLVAAAKEAEASAGKSGSGLVGLVGGVKSGNAFSRTSCGDQSKNTCARLQTIMQQKAEAKRLREAAAAKQGF